MTETNGKVEAGNSGEQHVEVGTSGVGEGESAARRIMVAVDGSEYADFAVQWTMKNVFQEKDELVLVHVAVPPMVPDFGFSTAYVTEALWVDVMQKANDQTRRTVDRYRAMARDLLKAHPQSTFRILSESGDPKEVLERLARELDSSIFVVGSRGFSSVKYVFVGSTSQYLVNHLEIPVIVVHKPRS